MKVLFAAILAVLLLASFVAAEEQSGLTPLPEGVQEQDAPTESLAEQCRLFSTELFCYKASGSRIILGLSFRPDRYEDFVQSPELQFQTLDSSWLQPSSYLGSLGEPLDKIVTGYLLAPRLLSISVHF
jgi:hypothetical protein